MSDAKRTIFFVIIASFASAGAVWAFFPRRVVNKVEIPKIETVYDTVDRLPKWYKDSVDHWKRRKATTDTVPLVFTNTIVDTEYVPVNAPPENRPDLCPVLSYHGGTRMADTAVVSSYSVRDGRLAVSRLFVPGILTDLEASMGNNIPRITFKPFPPEEKHGFWHNPKVFGIGFGSGAIVTSIACLVR